MGITHSRRGFTRPSLEILAVTLAAAAVLGLFAWAAHADPKITFVSGEVSTGGADGKTRALKKDDTVPGSSSVRVGKGSLALVQLDDGSILKLGESSEAKLDRANPQLLSGSVFAKVAKQPVGTVFKLRTKAATLGVRGTTFFTSYGNSEKPDDVWMCVQEGLVEAQTDGGTKVTAVKAGEGIFIPAGKDVTPPKPYGWTKKLNWNFDAEQGELKNKAKIESAYRDLLGKNYD